MKKQKVLAVGQCCDLISDTGLERVWECRGGNQRVPARSRERLVDGRWVLVLNHGQVLEH